MGICEVYETSLICSEFLLDVLKEDKVIAEAITPYELMKKDFNK